jgi:hypothetical protein
VLKAYADSLPIAKKHFRVKLNGIGLHCGKGVLIDKQDKMHGDVYNHAYHIGEDLCDGGNVLVSSDVKARLEQSKYFSSMSFKQTEDDKDIFSLEGTLPKEYH